MSATRSPAPAPARPAPARRAWRPLAVGIVDAVAQPRSSCCRWPPSSRSSLDGGLAAFWDAVTSRQAVAALRFTLVVVAASRRRSTPSSGTLIAWVLVRDDFRGKRVVNALIDLPFALPTIVAGLTLLALYGPTSPVGIDVAFTQARGAAGAAVRDAAVRRSARCSRCCSSSTARWRRRRRRSAPGR